MSKMNWNRAIFFVLGTFFGGSVLGGIASIFKR